MFFTVIVRTAVPADTARLAELITLAYRVEAFFVDGDRTNAEEVTARMQRGEFLILEERDGTISGCVYLERRGDVGYFGMLSVDPARQRQGLGARLVDAAEQHLRNAGCRAVEIEVVNLRTELPPFYERLGYVVEGARPFPDSQRTKLPCCFIVMTKPLRGPS